MQLAYAKALPVIESASDPFPTEERGLLQHFLGSHTCRKIRRPQWFGQRARGSSNP